MNSGRLVKVIMCMFEYDHTLLSVHELHKIGIRSTRELEEVIEGYSFAEEWLFVDLGLLCYSFHRFYQYIEGH